MAQMHGGRPTVAESRRRTRHFLALVAEGRPLDEAALEARVKPLRALRILSDRNVWRLLDEEPEEQAA